MSGVNKVILVGNLGKDPEVRNTESNKIVANFPLATSEVYKDREGNRQEQTEWHNLVLWEGTAKIAQQYLKKGDSIYIEGKIKTRSYQDKDNQTRYITEIVVQTLTMLGSPKGSNGQQNGQQGAYQGQQQTQYQQPAQQHGQPAYGGQPQYQQPAQQQAPQYQQQPQYQASQQQAQAPQYQQPAQQQSMPSGYQQPAAKRAPQQQAPQQQQGQAYQHIPNGGGNPGEQDDLPF